MLFSVWLSVVGDPRAVVVVVVGVPWRLLVAVHERRFDNMEIHNGCRWRCTVVVVGNLRWLTLEIRLCLLGRSTAVVVGHSRCLSVALHGRCQSFEIRCGCRGMIKVLSRDIHGVVFGDLPWLSLEIQGCVRGVSTVVEIYGGCRWKSTVVVGDPRWLSSEIHGGCRWNSTEVVIEDLRG